MTRVLAGLGLCATMAFAVVAQSEPSVHAASTGLGTIESVATALTPARRLAKVGSVFFPMDPLPSCYVLNNFGDPRSGGRSHVGEDIIASLGRNVYAVVDGTLNRQTVNGAANSSLSGNAWYLTSATGTTYFFYAHLSGFAPGLVAGSQVKQGDVIGYVGDTGDAGPGNYHLHFEVHPDGGAAVDPLPLLSVPFSCTIYK
jgi:murein DD-endopeptidase MepM/ murein hydrolase activator NlpD